MFIFALCCLKRSFIQSGSTFTIFYSWIFFTKHNKPRVDYEPRSAHGRVLNKRKYTSIDYSWSPRHSRFFATPFAGIISGLGIICGPIWGSFGGRDHLRARTGLISTFMSRTTIMHLSSASPRGRPWADVGTLRIVHFKVLVFPHPWGIFSLQSPQYLAKPSTQLDLKMHFRTLFWFLNS